MQVKSEKEQDCPVKIETLESEIEKFLHFLIDSLSSDTISNCRSFKKKDRQFEKTKCLCKGCSFRWNLEKLRLKIFPNFFTQNPTKTESETSELFRSGEQGSPGILITTSMAADVLPITEENAEGVDHLLLSQHGDEVFSQRGQTHNHRWRIDHIL